uniref:Uncharacterized protein n=1 Tax=Tetranychus urticae TaxID=32264 RepID=T1K3U3_TETUR
MFTIRIIRLKVKDKFDQLIDIKKEINFFSFLWSPILHCYLLHLMNFHELPRSFSVPHHVNFKLD